MSTPDDELTFVPDEQVTEVIRIEGDGRIFWRGREVVTDEEFRRAMLDLCDFFIYGRGKHN